MSAEDEDMDNITKSIEITKLADTSKSSKSSKTSKAKEVRTGHWCAKEPVKKPVKKVVKTAIDQAPNKEGSTRKQKRIFIKM